MSNPRTLPAVERRHIIVSQGATSLPLGLIFASGRLLRANIFKNSRSREIGIFKDVAAACREHGSYIVGIFELGPVSDDDAYDLVCKEVITEADSRSTFHFRTGLRVALRSEQEPIEWKT